GDELAVREVDQARRPEDQRQTDRGDRDDGAELDALDRQLDEPVEERRSRGGTAALAVPRGELEDHALVGAGTDDDSGHRLAALRAGRDTLGKLRGIQGHAVGPWAGQRDLPLAIVVRRGRAYLGVVLGHPDGEPRDRLPVRSADASAQ